MLENFLLPKLDDLLDEHGAEKVWFQQDGATAHTSHRSLGILREMFPGMLSPCEMTSGGTFARFDPVQYFLWGYFKAQVYQHRPQMLECLKEAITQLLPFCPKRPAGLWKSTGRGSICVSTMKAVT
jgi:hypothetical protein